jgi:transcription antitermination factor NusG
MDIPQPWYALRVRPRTEKAVSESLQNKGYEVFLPFHRQRRRWSDRVVDIHLPLFPGYLFARFDVLRRLPILKTPGVMFVVGIGNVPAPIDDVEIDALQIVVKSHLELQPWPFLRVGQRVRIISGPLADAEGILTAVKSRSRLVVSINLLQRSVAVEVAQECAWPVNGGPQLKAS